MVRDFDDEVQHRQVLRKKYFEDPNYRRWSDIVPGGIGGRSYMLWRDDRLFDYLITGQTSTISHLSQLKKHLKDGHELPINWPNFYVYFDARLNDPDNRFIGDLNDMIITDPSGEYSTVEKLLDCYRGSLQNGLRKPGISTPG